MSNNPRKIKGGGIIGGSPHGRNDSLIDAQNAVLMDNLHVVLVEPYGNGLPRPPMIAMQIAGRINKTKERADITYLFDEDGAAAIITELIALASRHGKEHKDALLAKVDERITDLALNGNL